MKGFDFAMAEYEAKMSDPYVEVSDEDDRDNYFTDEIEERMLEEQIEDFLWG